MSARLSEKKPWPLKAVVIAILLVIVPYTWITLKFRRPGPAYEPYADGKERANVIRLLSAGYQRINIVAEQPSDAVRVIEAGQIAAPVAAASGGLPVALKDTILDQPTLPKRIMSVTAPAEVSGLLPWRIAFTCISADSKSHFGDAHLYVREQSLVIVPQFEPLDGKLQARSQECQVVLTIPAGALKPGNYSVVLVGAEQSQAWEVVVR